MGEREDQHVHWEGKSGVRCWERERSFGNGHVGLIADGSDHVGGNIRVGEAEKAFFWTVVLRATGIAAPFMWARRACVVMMAVEAGVGVALGWESGPLLGDCQR